MEKINHHETVEVSLVQESPRRFRVTIIETRGNSAKMTQLPYTHKTLGYMKAEVRRIISNMRKANPNRQCINLMDQSE